jgi:predicted DCC family thiol-disulfide oxidoreductase YuxK/ligand-binding SRPBCC domain-containing protein
MTHTLDTQIRIPQPRDRVFPFFCDAFNLQRITPEELHFEILTPPPIEMKEGARIRYRLRLWGVPFHWETVIRCWEPPHRFVDEQVAGPYRRWVHRHELVETPRGTLVYDHVDYALPLPPVGDLFHPLLRRQLARIFRYRHTVLHQLFKSDDFPDAPLLIDAAPAPVPVSVRGTDRVREGGLRERSPEQGWEIKLLYDGACPFCRREMHWLKRRDRNDAILLEDISNPDFDPGRYGLTREVVDGKIHALLPDGRTVTGMDVFRRLYASVGLGWLMAPTGWPLLRPVFDAGYRLFARYRHRLGGRTEPECEARTCQARS